MTDTSSLAITHATTDSYPVHARRGSPAAIDGASDSGAPDEEPYTIKCICSFEEDDGSTVFCEGCETWQHILCYYPDKRVPEVHNCVDCEPRPLDNRRAHERQRQRRIREKSEDGDRKPKRSVNKSHKRKSKDADMTDFSLGQSESSARESLPAKKQRTSRHPSTGVSGSWGAPAESRNRQSSASVAVSPTNASVPFIPYYAPEFLSLYDHDDEFVETKSILNYGVDFVNEIVAWLKDPQILARVTDGLSVEDFAKRSEAALDRSRWPRLKTETITDSTVEVGGKQPIHKILTTQDAIRRDEVVGEIFGTVGHVKDYKKLDSNRWEELRHAVPFVFFNRQLDLYIDSRQEGNELRYVRRSCEPNVLLKIYITGGRQYHFCFVAKGDIPANTEITTMWYFDESFFFDQSSSTVQNKDRMVDPNDAAVCISNTLALFGGCACGHAQRGHPDACLLGRLDRRVKPSAKRVKSKPKTKLKRTKTQGGSGRAASETTKHSDENDAAADVRSTSGSAHDRHTGSRDLSPMASQQQVLPELSSRERRKIAEAEKQFEQMAQVPVNPKSAKRKRRRSERPTPATVSSSTQTGDDFKPYHETAPSRPQQTAEQPSRRRATYVDVQTELYADDVERSFNRTKREDRGYDITPLPLNTMQLARWSAGNHKEQDWNQRLAWESGDLSVVPPGVIPWWSGWYPHPNPGDTRSHVELLPEDADLVGVPHDIPIPMPPRWSFYQSKYPQPPVKYGKVPILGMHYDPPSQPAPEDVDIRGALPHNLSNSRPSRDPPKLSSPYSPSIVAHTFRIPGALQLGNKQISMPPPNVPMAASPGSASTGSLASPGSQDTTSPLSVLPASGASLAATPAKKKLSLGDYMIRRGTMATTPTPERSQAPAPPSASGPGPIRAQHLLAITTVFDDKNEIHRPNVEGDKNQSGSPDLDMMDVPPAVSTDASPAVLKDVSEQDAPESHQSQPTNTPPISS